MAKIVTAQPHPITDLVVQLKQTQARLSKLQRSQAVHLHISSTVDGV